MYVEKLTMKDFRCFEQAEVSFVYPGKEGLPEEALNNVILLMGENGAGKTSVLKGVALAMLSPIIFSMGYAPYSLVRRTPGSSRKRNSAIKVAGPIRPELHDRYLRLRQPECIPSRLQVELRQEDAETYRDSFVSQEIGSNEALDTGYQKDDSTDVFLLGYGATRRAEYLENLDSQRSRRRHPRFQRVAGLFEDYITLYPLPAWYPTLESKPRQKEVHDLLNSLLPDGTEFTGEFKDADGLFKHNGVKLPFGAMSDGFRSSIGLVADMLYHLNYVCPKKSKLTELSGVVMIDDIDVHLHPKWQREVVPKLAGTFPKLQFIITSHSPLVAGTLHAANIRVVEDNQIHEYTERIHGLSADQILTSSYFGLDTSRSAGAVEKLNRIAERVADEGDPSAAIDFLNELAGTTNGHHAKKTKKPRKKK